MHPRRVGVVSLIFHAKPTADLTGWPACCNPFTPATRENKTGMQVKQHSVSAHVRSSAPFVVFQARTATLQRTELGNRSRCEQIENYVYFIDTKLIYRQGPTRGPICALRTLCVHKHVRSSLRTHALQPPEGIAAAAAVGKGFFVRRVRIWANRGDTSVGRSVKTSR